MHTTYHKALAREWNPETLLKDDRTMLPVRSTEGTKAYEPNRDHLQPMLVAFAQGALSIINLDSFRGCEVQSNYLYFRRSGGLRARNKQWLPWEVPGNRDGQGEHPAEPGWASTPSQGWATPKQVPQPLMASETRPTSPLRLAASGQTAGGFICLSS